MDQNTGTSTRPSVREIGTDGMMMHYTDPQIIAEQIAALKNLDLIGEAMESIEAHNPVLAAAIRSGHEHFIDYGQMLEKPVEYGYEGVDGGAYISQTYTWVAKLHYELQTVALFSLMAVLESGELQQDQIADYSVALGDTSVAQNGFLALNYNPSRQPHEFFDSVTERLVAEGFGVKDQGYDRRYLIPGFLWVGLNSEQRGRLAAEILGRDFSGTWGSFEERTLRRDFGKLLSAIFVWHKDLNRPALVEGASRSFNFDYGNRFAQGRIEFTADGFIWIEELRGLSSTR